MLVPNAVCHLNFLLLGFVGLAWFIICWFSMFPQADTLSLTHCSARRTKRWLPSLGMSWYSTFAPDFRVASLITSFITTTNPKPSNFLQIELLEWCALQHACGMERDAGWDSCFAVVISTGRSDSEDNRDPAFHTFLFLIGLCSVQGHWKLNHTLYGFLGQQVSWSADGPSSPAPQLVTASIGKPCGCHPSFLPVVMFIVSNNHRRVMHFTFFRLISLDTGVFV
jgi:hypothetical protein